MVKPTECVTDRGRSSWRPSPPPSPLPTASSSAASSAPAPPPSSRRSPARASPQEPTAAWWKRRRGGREEGGGDRRRSGGRTGWRRDRGTGGDAVRPQGSPWVKQDEHSLDLFCFWADPLRTVARFEERSEFERGSHRTVRRTIGSKLLKKNEK
jgi:hypothetical protein